MLSDPLTVKGLDLNASTTISTLTVGDFAITDVAPGKSVRKCSVAITTGGPAVLTISHSESNENKPAKTDRSLVRLDFLCKDVNGREMNAFAYAVIGIPRGAVDYQDPESPLSPRVVAEALIGALCGITASALSVTRLDKVLAGEP